MATLKLKTKSPIVAAVVVRPTESPCMSCGACCAYSHDWPEFTDGDDDLIIPDALLDLEVGRMKCTGDRCNALDGDIGVSVRCTVYEQRPRVCREFTPLPVNCDPVRKWLGLPVLPVHDMPWVTFHLDTNYARGLADSPDHWETIRSNWVNGEHAMNPDEIYTNNRSCDSATNQPGDIPSFGRRAEHIGGKMTLGEFFDAHGMPRN